MKKILVIITAFVAVGCTSILDKKDLGAVTDETVWSDVNYAKAYVNKLYVDNQPGWDNGISGYSDESNSGSSILYGQLDINSINEWHYSGIRNINLFLGKMEGSKIETKARQELIGQALFLRAWRYFQMVRQYGGVPIIKVPQEITDPDIMIKRSKTSECIAFILDDLKTAQGYLPWSWGGDDTGRTTRATAQAFAARVQLYWASPQFNPNSDKARWDVAYTMNKAAVDDLSKNGFGLYKSYDQFWFNEMNEEVVFVTRYNYPGRTNNWNAATRPLTEAQNATGSNHPTWDLVKSYPMINGKTITDPTSGYDPIYFWKNRDPRFTSSIAYNGCVWELSGKTGRVQWNYNGSPEEANSGSGTGFYCRKAVETSYEKFYTENSSTDWVELRYAEVLLNFAECAAETGQDDEAINVLKAIRNRAGIESGADGNYGLPGGLTGKSLITAIMNERKIEFAFEGKRYWDLRRRRMFTEELNGTRRTRIRTFVNAAYEKTINDIRGTIAIDSEYPKYFKDEVELSDKNFDINFKDSYYFYAIPRSHLEQNPNLEQTQGWENGTFDPLL